MPYLVKYEGGGYDGCLWENNYFVTDSVTEPTEFWQIYASGYKGIKTLEQAQAIPQKVRDDEWSVYDLDRQDDWDSFVRSVTQLHARAVAKAIWEDLYGLVFKCDLVIVCNECGGRFDYHDVDCHEEDYYGCGGIAVDCDTALCESCYQARQIAFIYESITESLDFEDFEDWDALSDEDKGTVIDYALKRVSASDAAEWIIENLVTMKKEILCEDDQLTL